MTKYATELEARLGFVAHFARFAAIKEGSAEHKALVAAYNAATDGYNMTINDPWCAASISAVAALEDYKQFPLECSCSRMLAKAQKNGIRVEKRGYRPMVGDWILYDLDLKGSTTDHIGVIIGIDGDDLWVLEGNFGNTVKARAIRYDDPRISYIICPDYKERVMLQKEEAIMAHYTTVAEVPEFARPTIEMLVDRGLLLGIDIDDLGLTDELVRTLVILNRAGAFISKT